MEIEIHMTEVETFLLCQRKHFFAHILNIVPKIPNRRLWLGQGAHTALAEYYRGNTTDPAKVLLDWGEEGLQRIAMAGAPREDIDKSYKDLMKMVGVLEKYPEWAFQNDRFKVLRVKGEPCVEVPFRIKMPFVKDVGVEENCYFAGTFDLLVEDEDTKRVQIMDHKTTSSFAGPIYQDLNLQVTGYLLASDMLLLGADELLYNEIGKFDPKRNGPEKLFVRTSLTRTHEEKENLYALLLRVAREKTSEIRHVTERNRDLDQISLPTCYTPSKMCDWGCHFSSLCLAYNKDNMSAVHSLLENLYEFGGESDGADPSIGDD